MGSPCPACNVDLDAPSASTVLVRCHSCQAAFVPPGSSHVSLEHATDPTIEGIPEALMLSPEFLERWRPDRLLGAGAFGTVYRADDLDTGQRVAVKFLTRIGHRDVLERFIREGRLMGRIAHPRVVSLLHAGEINGVPFLVSELLTGGTLRERFRKTGALSPAAAVAVGVDILEGLAAVHAAGIVHRDIKPENILFDGQDRAKLADLGIARALEGETAVTQAGMLMGTPLYMSPEQGLGETATALSDIYSVGFVLYEMLAGAVPFRADRAAEMVRLHLERQPPPLQGVRLGVPDALAAVVHRALAKRPEKRYPTADAMIAALRASLADARDASKVGAKRPQVEGEAGAPTGAVAPTRPEARPRTAGPATSPRAAQVARAQALAAAQGPGLKELLVLSAVCGLLVIVTVAYVTGWFAGPPQSVAGPDRAAHLVSEGIVAYRAGQLPDAERLFAAAIAANPSYARAHYNLGVVQSDRGRKPEAEQSYRTALRWDPKFAIAGENLATLLSARSQFAEAEALLRDAVAAAPTSARTHYNLGAFLDKRGRTPEAEESFRKAIDLDPNLMQAHLEMGKQLARRGHLAAAEASLSRALALDPKSAEALCWRGLTFEKLNRFPEAEADLAAAATLAPANAWIKTSVAGYRARLAATAVPR